MYDKQQPLKGVKSCVGLVPSQIAVCKLTGAQALGNRARPEGRQRVTKCHYSFVRFV